MMILATCALLLQSGDASPLSTEGLRAAERGLRYLESTQQADGSWNGDVGYKLQDGYRTWNRNDSHVGVTALAGMAFLAGGYVPGRGPRGEVVERATTYLMKQVRDDGYITDNETRMYSHAFSTLFLAEVYGMNRREDVRQALQRAIDLIVSSQNRQGGWRYQPHAADSDMSVAVCQVMALRAARNIGIQVPVNTIDSAVDYVKKSAVREGDPTPWGIPDPPGSFRYQPTYDSRATFALTSAGVTILHGAGVYGDEDIEKGLDYLESELSSFSRSWGNSGRMQGHYFFYYGHYYAVQAFHMAGGRRWERYFRHIQNVLIDMQEKEGSWPNSPGPGRNYATATACLILQIPKEYLPIFQR